MKKNSNIFHHNVTNVFLSIVKGEDEWEEKIINNLINISYKVAVGFLKYYLKRIKGV